MAKKKKDTAVPSEGWTSEVEYVGFYARVLAMLVDTLVIMLPLSAAFGVMYVFAWGGTNFGEKELALITQSQGDPVKTQEAINYLIENGHFTRLLMENVIFSIASGVLILVMWYFFSATPGKMMMGMKIVDAKTGEAPSNKQNIIRYMGYFISGLAMLVGFLWVGWDKRKQGWHDKMADTVVVYKRSLPAELAAETTASKDKEKDA